MTKRFITSQVFVCCKPLVLQMDSNYSFCPVALKRSAQ